MAVSDPQPRLLVAGPALLLHLDIERRGGVTVFRAPRRDGTDADCRSGPRRNGDVLAMTPGPIHVGEAESLCVTVARRTMLSWHARGSLPLEPALHQASLP